MRQIALLISGIFHPILMPTMLCFLCFMMEPFELYHYSARVKGTILILVFLISGIMPILITIWHLGSKNLKRLMLQDKNDRDVPYITTAISLATLFFFFKYSQLSDLIYLPLLGGCIAIVLAFVINKFWKISAHAIGMGGAVALLWVLKDTFLQPIWIVLVILLLIAGLVGTARLYLNEHEPNQVLAGYLLGFFALWICLI